MASRNIKGITIEIDGQTRGLQDSLKDVNASLKQTQSALRDVDKLLKMDPKNTELLKQKQDLLSDAIKGTETKLAAEKTALEQLKNADPSPENTRNMQTLQRQIAEDEQQLKSLKEESKDFGSVFKQQMEAAGQSLKDVGGKMTEVGSTLSTNLTAPIVAMGTAAVAAWGSVDSAMDEMIKMTGATGDSFEEMKGIVEDLATSIPVDMDAAAQAVGEVNTRFGATGDELEALSATYLKFAELNNTDVVGAVDATQSAMAAWGLTAQDAAGFLDLLTAASQQTGADATQLADVVGQNKAVFDAMGFSVSDATMFLANLEKNGVDSSQAMTGLKKALQNATSQGISAKAALMILDSQLRNADSDTEAFSAATELFGAKAGPALVSAIQDGRISLEALGTTLDDTAGTVDGTFEAILDPADKFKTTMNQLKITGAEVGGTLLEALSPAIDAVAGAIKSVAEWWKGLSPEAQNAILIVMGIVAAIGPLIGLMGSIISMVGTLSTVIGLLSGPIGIVVAAIAAVIAIGVLLYKNWDTIKAKAGELKDKIVNAWNTLKQNVTDKVNAIKEGVSNAWNTMTMAVSEKMNAMKEMAQGKLDAIKNAYNNAGGGIKGIVSGMMEGVKQYFTLGFDTINALTGGKLNAIKEKFSSILTGAKNIVSNVINSIKSFFNFSWSLPKLKLPHVSITGSFSLVPPSVPKFSISWYKKAYQDPVLFTHPTVIPTVSGMKGFGDGAGAEVVMGLNKLKEMVGGNRGGVVNTFNIYTQPGQDANAIAQAVSEILYDQYEAAGF